ncbi:BatA domain-containing protein [Hymenobacter sp. UV11]|uniref:BatA domain-containing protein n=1 Tax=Hymenobacter sp. UV11 TaxID=1849735 RepID=UPI0014150A2F|nr:BatA domain-containing protein [Hymenobacter sp. UV11]
MQLLYPGFLWGLLAVGIPIAIHLLQLRRPHRVLFTNTGFIREVELTTMRRRRLQELLVLLTRILGVLFLVLVFCQPFIPTTGQTSRAASGVVEMALDNSGSMQAAGSIQPQLLQEAIIGATTLSKSYGPTTHFLVVGQSSTNISQSALPEMLSEQAKAGRRLGWGSTSVRDAWQKELQGSLYVFSDFQKNEISSQAVQQLTSRGNVVLIPLAAKPAGNLYVDSVWLNDAFVRARVTIALHIRLRNGGREKVADAPVKVLLGKQQVAAFRVSVAAGQVTETTVQIQLPDNNLAAGQVVIEDAPVTFDNTYYFTLKPSPTVHVVEIGEEPATKAAYANEPLFDYKFSQPQRVDYGVLRQANLVLVREVARMEPGLRDALVAVARRGGSVVVVPTSNPVGRASYHELFRALGIGGEQWVAGSEISVKQELALPNARDPFFKDVLGAQPQRVAMPQVAPIVQMRQAGRDILRLRDGGGYLTEFASGSGRAYVFAAPFAKEYADFTAHSLFVPVLYRLAMLSYHDDQQPAYRLDASAFTLAVPVQTGQSAPDAANYRLEHDSLTYIPAQRVLGGQLHLEIPVGLDKPGFYTLTQRGKPVTTLAFNMPKRESELAAYSVAELRQLIGPNQPNVRVLDIGAQPEALARYGSQQTGRPLWRYCLLLVLASLLAEALLLRFGRQRGVGPRAVVG